MSAITDLLELSDTDLAQMLDREMVCQLQQMLKENGESKPPWCTEQVTHRIIVSCRRCGESRRLYLCLGCTRLVVPALRALALTQVLVKTKHGCPRPAWYRVTAAPVS